MNGKTITIVMIAVALLAAGAAAYFANGYIQRAVAAQAAEIKKDYEPVRVVVANADLPPGTVLNAQTVSVREYPKTYVSPSAILADNWGAFRGRVLSTPVGGGEAILQAHLATEIGAGFSNQLPPGQRALTFPVNDESSIAQLLQPGDRIDLLFTTTSGNESVTVPLLYGVQVIATGVKTLTNEQQVGDQVRQSGYTTVTVAVSPEDAAKITLAQQSGKVTVTLRQRKDEEHVKLARINKATLLSQERVVTHGYGPVQIIIGGQ